MDDNTRMDENMNELVQLEDTPEEQLYQSVLCRWCLSAWTASGVCEFAWLHRACGGRGLKDFAIDPAQRGRNQSRRVKKVLDIDGAKLNKVFYYVTVWVHDKWANKRKQIKVPMLLADEVLEDLYNDQSSILDSRNIDERRFHTSMFCSILPPSSVGPRIRPRLGYTLTKSS